ncbi:hypothetical protein M569_15225, partial [Genlisea aurea]
PRPNGPPLNLGDTNISTRYSVPPPNINRDPIAAQTRPDGSPLQQGATSSAQPRLLVPPPQTARDPLAAQTKPDGLSQSLHGAVAKPKLSVPQPQGFSPSAQVSARQEIPQPLGAALSDQQAIPPMAHQPPLAPQIGPIGGPP